jgi:hypothetical protein
VHGRPIIENWKSTYIQVPTGSFISSGNCFLLFPISYKYFLILDILKILGMLSIPKIFSGYASAYPAYMVAPPMELGQDVGFDSFHRLIMGEISYFLHGKIF